jgi:acetylornithine deacetylase/succinyl-diaminopimelate desuccinylase-like protein
VKNQSTQKVLSAFEQWLKTIMPPYVKYTFAVRSAYEAMKIKTTAPHIKKAERILQTLYDQKVHYIYAGNGQPILSLLHQELQLPFVLVPLVNEDSNVHGVNENFDVGLIEKGMQFSHAFFAQK